MSIHSKKSRYQSRVENLFLLFNGLFNIYGFIWLLYFILRFTIGESANFVAFCSNCIPLALFPSFIALPIALKKRDRFMTVWGGFILFFLFIEFGARFFPVVSKRMSCTSTNSIRVLTHNTGQDLPGYALRDKLIQDSQADIVLLQEITDNYIEQHWSQFQGTYPYQIHTPLQVDGEKLVGMGILSRYPIREKNSFKLDEDGLVYQMRVVIDTNNGPIVFYNVHTTFPWIRTHPISSLLGELPVPVYDDTVRRREIQNLIKLVKQENSPVILAGDFNLNDQSDDYKELIESGLTDAYRNVGHGFGFTWPVNRTPSVNIWHAIPFVRVDYFFHSKDVSTCFAQVLPKTGSDHLPLIVNVLLE